MEQYYLTDWTNATGNLDWGVQHAFHDVLVLAAEEKTTLVYSADYYEKGACLVNQAANLLLVGGGHGVPMAQFGPVVSLFDSINRELAAEGVNTKPSYVSPLAAEILLHNFAPLKPEPEKKNREVVLEEHQVTYTEPTDEQMQQSLMEMLSATVIEENETGPEFVFDEAEYARLANNED